MTRFILSRFAPNASDVFRVGSIRMNKSLLKAEFLHDHRIRSRVALARLLPKNGIAAEFGVFTGLFSTILLEEARPRHMYFVDPWSKEFGDRYPDWGVYTDHGKLATADAREIAKKRIARRSGETNVEVIVGYSTDFLAETPERLFDWVYLDSTHSYEGTRHELSLLRTKVKSGGIIAGDDWNDDDDHPHAGVARAVREALKRKEFEELRLLPPLQWTLSVP
jgi:hypothetical protein